MTPAPCPEAGNFENFWQGSRGKCKKPAPLPRLPQVKVKLQDLSGAFPGTPGKFLLREAAPRIKTAPSFPLTVFLLTVPHSGHSGTGKSAPLTLGL